MEFVSLTLNSKHRLFIVVTIASYLFSLLFVTPTLAVSDFIKENAYVYNPQSITANVTTCIPSGAIASLDDTTPSALPSLPLSTITSLDNAKVKELATRNKSAYLAGEQATGVPWTVLAALHYREASMNSNRSMLNGQPIGNQEYTNVDGKTIATNLNSDAINAGNVFKRLALGTYGVNVSKDSSALELGNAFLAYNRGFMYKNWGKTYLDSPYVMNGYDASHINMKWIDADSYVSPAKKAQGDRENSVSGRTETRPGALAVYTYLGGTAGIGGSASCVNGSIVSGDIVSTATSLALNYDVSTQSSPWSSKAKPEFVAALKEFNPTPAQYLGEAAYADCGVYVSTVMRASGVDPTFPPSGTAIQKKYLSDNTDKYRINNSPSLSTLTPGDIILVNNGRDHHVVIYTGEIGEAAGGSKKYVMVDASQERRVPSYRTSGDLNWILGRSGVFSATYIGGKVTPDAQ